MFERWMARMLMAKAGEGAGGGAGGGDDGGDDDDKLTKKINDVVHAALKGERKRIAKDVVEEIGPSFGEMVQKGIGDAFAKYEAEKNKGGEGGAGKGGEGGGSGTAATTEIERQMKALQAENEKIQRKLQDEETRRKAAETKQLRDEEYSQLVSGLTERGVRKALIGMAAKDLHARIVRDPKTNDILWKEGEDELDLAKGLDKYMESEAGKELLPPRDVGGSGNRGAGGTRNTGKQELDHAGFANKLIGNG